MNTSTWRGGISDSNSKVILLRVYSQPCDDIIRRLVYKGLHSLKRACIPTMSFAELQSFDASDSDHRKQELAPADHDPLEVRISYYVCESTRSLMWPISGVNSVSFPDRSQNVFRPSSGRYELCAHGSTLDLITHAENKSYPAEVAFRAKSIPIK